MCIRDRLRATNPEASETYIRGNGLKDEKGDPVLAVKDEWIIGLAATEIPWLGAAKLAISGTSSQVTDSTWRSLAMVVALIIASPYLMEAIAERRKDESDLDQPGQDDWHDDDE